MMSPFILYTSFAVAIAREGMPGHELSFYGSIEALMHIWVGMLIVWCFDKRTRWIAGGSLIALTVFEIFKFLTR